MQPKENNLTQEEFSKVYPQLVVYMSENKKSGVINDAYFIGGIMNGAIFLASGDATDSARDNGKKVAHDLMSVFKENKTNKEQCTLGAKMMS